MKRALIFLIVGPAVGFLLALGTAMAIGVSPWEPMFLAVVFAYSYKAGIIPAALTGLMDARLAARTTFAMGIIQTTGIGFVVSALVGLFLLERGTYALLIYAIYGAVAAAVCSWLSRRSTRTVIAS